MLYREEDETLPSDGDARSAVAASRESSSRERAGESSSACGSDASDEGQTPGRDAAELTTLLRPGDRFGPDLRYQLHQPIGVGGSAAVYMVHDRVLDRCVAGKFLVPTTLSVIDATPCREGQILARLRHESIVHAHDHGFVGNVPYLVMELLRGDTLASILATARLSELRATQVLIDVVKGLLHAHDQGVLHLDIKPGNVFILENGRAKIIDFGAARAELAGDAASRGDDEESFVRGTLHYMAPEQWALAPLDARTDIWAAGMVYYEMLSGRLPYGNQPSCFRMRTTELERAPLSIRGRVSPAAVDAIIARTLTADPGRRFRNASELLSALLDVQSELSRAEQPCST